MVLVLSKLSMSQSCHAHTHCQYCCHSLAYINYKFLVNLGNHTHKNTTFKTCHRYSWIGSICLIRLCPRKFLPTWTVYSFLGDRHTAVIRDWGITHGVNVSHFVRGVQHSLTNRGASCYTAAAVGVQGWCNPHLEDPSCPKCTKPYLVGYNSFGDNLPSILFDIFPDQTDSPFTLGSSVHGLTVNWCGTGASNISGGFMLRWCTAF